MVPLFLIFPFKKLKIKHNIFWLFTGSVISDVIDKSASFFNIWGGRGVAHTLLFFISSVIILQLIAKDKTKTTSYSLGFIIHIIMDLPLPVFFYPSTGNINFMFNPYVNFSKIDYFIGLLLHNSILMITELIGFIFLTTSGFYLLIKKYFSNLNKDVRLGVGIIVVESIQEVKKHD